MTITTIKKEKYKGTKKATKDYAEVIDALNTAAFKSQGVFFAVEHKEGVEMRGVNISTTMMAGIVDTIMAEHPEVVALLMMKRLHQKLHLPDQEDL